MPVSTLCCSCGSTSISTSFHFLSGVQVKIEASTSSSVSSVLTLVSTLVLSIPAPDWEVSISRSTRKRFLIDPQLVYHPLHTRGDHVTRYLGTTETIDIFANDLGRACDLGKGDETQDEEPRNEFAQIASLFRARPLRFLVLRIVGRPGNFLFHPLFGLGQRFPGGGAVAHRQALPVSGARPGAESAGRPFGQFVVGLAEQAVSQPDECIRPRGNHVDGVQTSVGVGDFGKHVRRLRLSPRTGGQE